MAVTAVTEESRTVRSISLADPDGVALPEWLPGQSITVRLPFPENLDDDRPLIRNYSLSNQPGTGVFRISVKRETHGLASGYLHDRLMAGDLIDVAAPRGTFFLAEGDAPVILLSAGVGVTPVLAMLHGLVRAESQREIWWLHGTRDRAEHAFVAEIRELLDRLPHSRSHVFYSRPAVTDRHGSDFTDRGRISIDAVRALGVPLDADAYLCGPATFMSGLGADLVGYGLDPARVHTELFGAAAALTPGIAATSIPPHQPAGPPGPGPDVQFARSGISAPWGPPSVSLLEFAESCDVPTRWSCRTGVCHNCETALLAGRVRYDPEPLEPPAEGNILICCAQPVEACVVDL
jgi:ferredoxin-NADP reductase